MSSTDVKGIINIRGTSVDNNKICVNLHIHIHTENERVIDKIGRALNGLIGQRHRTIENASSLSSDQLQRCIIQGAQDE